MTTPSERVRTLVREGKIGAEEAEHLLAAIGAGAGERRWQVALTRPFERFGGGHAAAIGLAVSLIAILVSRTGVRFDGVFDVHYVRSFPVGTAVLDELANWPLAALIFLAVARLFRLVGRPLDFLGVTGLSRLPSVLTAWPAVWLRLRGAPVQDGLTYVLSVTLVTAGMVAQVALLFHGFQNATGAKGTRLALAFMTGAVASEVVSKVLTTFVF